MKYNKLTVLGFDHLNKHRKQVVLCLCDCGNKHLALLTEVKSGHTQSCGCFRPNLKHGMYKTAFYQCWADMKRRCTKPDAKQYHDYGGRGITVCEAWLDFQNFYNDMFETYSPKLTIERINNDLGYYKENCRWATRAEQNRNTRRTKRAEEVCHACVL